MMMGFLMGMVDLAEENITKTVLCGGGNKIRTLGSIMAPGPSALRRVSAGGAERVIREFCLVV
jgi:hypothetical protein